MPWIAPVIGAGAGILGSLFGPDEQTTTQQNFPSPFLTGNYRFDSQGNPNGYNLLGYLSDLIGQSAEQGAGIVNNMGREQQANDALFNRGLSGNPLEGAGASYIQNILGGGGIAPKSNRYIDKANQFLGDRNYGSTWNTLDQATQMIGGQGLNPNSNPYLEQTFNRAADLTRSRLASEFAGSGRDLSASQPARSEELQTLASNIYGGNYQNERNRQTGLIGQSLGLGQQNLQNQRGINQQNIENQRGVYQGGQGLGLQQQMGALSSALPFANQDFTNINAMLQGAGNPINTLINRISSIAPAAGGTATVSQPVYNNPFTAGLGGAALGSQLGGIFSGMFGNKPTGGGNPYGGFY